MSTLKGFNLISDSSADRIFAVESLEARCLLSGVTTAIHHRAAVPVAPSALSATATSGTQIKLNWVDNATNETSYAVFRKTSKHGKYVAIATLSANSTYLRNRGLTPNGNYWYYVQAVNAAGSSAVAEVAHAQTPGVSSTPTPTPTPTPTTGVLALDKTFNGTGELINTDVPGARRVAIQSDGKIVVLTRSGTGELLRRFNSSGSVDTSFGTGGSVTVRAPYGFTSTRAMVLQSDGKIVVAGEAGTAPSSNPYSLIWVARFNTDGSVDTAFGDNGHAQYSGPTLSHTRSVADVAVGPNGSIVVAGSDADSFYAYRFTAAGALDTSFGTGGAVIDKGGGFYEDFAGASALAIDPHDGSVVIVGDNLGSSMYLQDHTYSLEVRRFTTSGAVTRWSVPGGGFYPYVVNDVTIQPDGKIVVAAGFGYSEADLFRFNLDGTRDTSFTGNRLGALTGVQGAYAYTSSLRLSNGAFLAGGFLKTSNGSLSDFMLTRITAAGATDTSAGGTGGVITTDLGADDEEITSLALEPDGSIIAAGVSGGHLALLRFRAT